MRSAQFQALVEKHPENFLFRFSLAQALVAEGRHRDAVPHLIACANSKADWMFPRILAAKSLIALGHRDEARPWIEEALKLAVEQNHEDPEHELRGLLADLEK